jgi:Protein of unknown function (DUF2971)
MAPYEELLASLRTKHDTWDATWREQHVEADHHVLYHYTDAQGLLGIVQSQQLWASNAAFLNDSTELTYIRGVLAEVAKEFRDEYGVTARIREYAASAVAGTGRFSPTEGQTASVISILESAPTMAGSVFDVYVSCFCSHGDLLSQWRGYPSSGGGYALGLRPESIRRGGGVLRRVIYDEETQRRLLYDLLAPIVDAMASADPDDAKDLWDWLVREHLGRVYASLQECSFCFKHPGFTEESEWRLVILRTRDQKQRPNDAPPDLRATRTGLLPYLRRSLEGDGVAEVVVGPSSQPTLAADAAVQLLRNAGYENARDMVLHSAIPLRV